MCKGRRFLIGCYPTASIFFASVHTQEKEAGATFAWDIYKLLSLETWYQSLTISQSLRRWWWSACASKLPGSSSGEGTSLLVFLTPRELARRPRDGLFPFIPSRCNAKKCHDDQPPVTNSTGAPNGNFWKISVRKTIWDLEFSEHLL